MPFQIASGNNTANVANVDSNSNLFVNLPTISTSAGYVKAVAEVDSGTVTGTSLVRAPKVTIGRSTLNTPDTAFIYENFNYSAQNTADYKYLNTTLTTTFGGGYATFNSGSTTAAGETLLQTYRTIPLFTTGVITCAFNVCLNIQPVANFQCEFGVFFQSGSAPYTPADGVYFRINSSGLFGVANFNGNETTTTTLIGVGSATLINPTTYQIIFNSNKIEFWELGTSSSAQPILLGFLFTPLAQPFTSGALPISVRQLQTGTTSSSIQLKLAWLAANVHDYETNKPWSHIMAGDGAMAYQGQNGGTMGSTALSVNNTAPTAAVPSNTAANLGTGLGGLFYSTATIATNTDGIISSYQNPLGSTTQQPRGLYITGVRVDTVVITTALNAAIVLSWGLAFGHTAVSLATTETATTKAPRRITVGLQSVAAAIGSQAPTVSISLTTPIYLNPGEYIQTFYRNIGTAATAGTLAHSIIFDGYWE